MTPDQDNNELISTWPSNSTDVHQTSFSCAHSHNNSNSNHNNNGNKFAYKCHTLGRKSENLQHNKDLKSEQDPQDNQHPQEQQQQQQQS